MGCILDHIDYITVENARACVSPPPDIFLSSVADQIVTGQAINEWIEAYQWSGKCGNSLVCDSSSSLFSLFSGYHARNLAIILSHLNVIFFHIYSKISAVFLTMALLFRCLLAYRLKKRRMSACSSCFFLLAPTFFSFKHQAVTVGLSGFSKRCREPAFTGSTKCTIEGGVVTVLLSWLGKANLLIFYLNLYLLFLRD